MAHMLDKNLMVDLSRIKQQGSGATWVKLLYLSRTVAAEGADPSTKPA